jgi:hypothetical protein
VSNIFPIYVIIWLNTIIMVSYRTMTHNKTTTTLAMLAAPVVAAATLIFMSVPMVAQADPDNGNNGQCIQVQKILPPEVQDYEGCHDTFTGPGHNEPPPLP